MTPAQRMFERLVDEGILPPLSWAALTTDEVRAFESAEEEAIGGSAEPPLDDDDEFEDELLEGCLTEVDTLAKRSKFVSADELREIVSHYRSVVTP